MAVEQQTTVSEPGTQTAEPPAGAKNTETQTPGAQPDAAEHMIPKSRFDEVNKRLRELEKAQADAAKAKTDAETAALAEQNKYKELWEKAQKDAEKATAEALTAKQEVLRLKVIGKVPGFPAAWADRLRGDTEEDMEADAKSLMAALPKPAAPNANAAPGDGGKPRQDVPNLETIHEQAARLGVSFNALKKQYGIND